MPDTDPRYRALRDAIDSDPAHAARTDAEVATVLNAPIPGPNRPISLDDLAGLLDRRGLIVPLEEATGKWGTPHADPKVRRAARAALSLLNNPRRSEARADDAQLLAGLDILEGAGLLDTRGPDGTTVLIPGAVNRAAILALAATTTTAARQIPGWGFPVSEHDVRAARELDLE